MHKASQVEDLYTGIKSKLASEKLAADEDSEASMAQLCLTLEDVLKVDKQGIESIFAEREAEIEEAKKAAQEALSSVEG